MTTSHNTDTRPDALDTQWPRWEVFKQDNAKRPYQAVGSVHAGDPQHALLTARNIFVRRPAAVSLWAVREDHILTATPEELERDPELFARHSHADHSGQAETYHVGIKRNHKRSMTFVDLVGTVEAQGLGDALKQATEQHAEAITWLVFADQDVVRTDDDTETVASWFEPAKEKTYKQQQYYGVVGRHISAYKAEKEPRAKTATQAAGTQATEARLPPNHKDAKEQKEGLA